ncbi:MAG TPA: hypothetical protein VIT44_07045 [Cyclobacteriaceae bacterium]
MDNIKRSTSHPLTQLVIPTNAEDLISLAEKILACHQQKGSESPLKVQMIADLSYKCAQAKIKHEEGMKYKRLMDDVLTERDQFLGLKESLAGVTSITSVISFLAEILESTQCKEELSIWGFQHKKS